MANTVHGRNAAGACLKPPRFPQYRILKLSIWQKCCPRDYIKKNPWTDFDPFWTFCCPVLHVISVYGVYLIIIYCIYYYIKKLLVKNQFGFGG